MQTQTQTLSISHWSQLTKDQLEYVLTEEDRVKTYLYLMGLRIETENILPDFGNSEDMTMEEYGEWLDIVEALLNGKKICLRTTDNGQRTTDEWGYADAEDLAYASIEQLKWLETDHTLLSLPFETIKIGRHTYKVPDALMINTTYQQYSNAQGYMQQYWRILKQAISDRPSPQPSPVKRARAKDTGTSAANATSQTDTNSPALLTGGGTGGGSALVQYAKQMVEARNGFMAAILTPYRYKVKPRYPFLFREPLWDADSEKEIKADMAHAPSWLFDALYKQWQDNIKHFSKKFPDMFSEAKEDPKHDAFIAELGTINLVIEKGGYNNAAAVYDENCVFIFKLLNDQIKEAKELERINKESKAKR